MSLNLNRIAFEIYSELIRSITGQLFTKEQISQITSHTVGKYLADFFPESEKDKKAIERVEEAKKHISEASSIISEMQSDLEVQTQQLDVVLKDIEEKKKLAEKYAELASTNQEKFEAFKEEMATSLRSELELQSAKGKTIRRIASIIIWVGTLIIGAALGTYFKDILSYIKSIIV